MPITGVSHIAICVSDIDAAVDFYCNALCFRVLGRTDVSSESVRQLLELDELDMELVFIGFDGLRIELVGLRRPQPIRTGMRPFNTTGPTHLSLHVADFDATLDALERKGVAVRRNTVGGDPASNARFAFITDPDGNRIEIFGAIDEGAPKAWETFGAFPSS